MATTNIIGNNNNLPLLPNFNLQNIRKDFDMLRQALQNGNVVNARKAFGAVQNDINNIINKNNIANAQTRANGQNNQAINAFNALAQALNNGNLAGAQQAFATLEQGQRAPQAHAANVGQNANKNTAVRANNNLHHNNDLINLVRDLAVANNIAIGNNADNNPNDTFNRNLPKI